MCVCEEEMEGTRWWVRRRTLLVVAAASSLVDVACVSGEEDNNVAA